MRKIALIILFTFVIASRADLSAPRCSSEINTSLGYVNQLIVSLKSGELDQIKIDFITIENIIKNIDSSCSKSIWPAVQSFATISLLTCSSVVEDLLSNLKEFQLNKINDETDIINILWFLINRSFLFSSACFAGSKIEAKSTVDSLPKPECIAQAYQSLDTLYQFQADSECEDVDQLKDDFIALLDVTKSLNDYCVPTIVVNTTSEGSGNCQDDMETIHGIMVQFTQGDPTNYLNVIQTIQSLWNAHPAFSVDCTQESQAGENSVGRAVETNEECHKALAQTFEKLVRISEDAMIEDLKGILGSIYGLKMNIFDINASCDASLHVELFSGVELGRGSCNEHFGSMRSLFSHSKVEKVEDFADMTQKVWNLAYRFLHDC